MVYVTHKFSIPVSAPTPSVTKICEQRKLITSDFIVLVLFKKVAVTLRGD